MGLSIHAAVGDSKINLFGHLVPKPRINQELFVDMVPSSCWFSNLRSELTAKEWRLVKDKTTALAGGCCEVYGGRGPKWPVECHERWGFNLETGVQTLLGVIALCPDCHLATHMGLARVKDLEEKAEAQLMRVNGWTHAQTLKHIDEAEDLWIERSSVDRWLLNATWILDFVDLSDKTKDKINGHAKGLIKRIVGDKHVH